MEARGCAARAAAILGSGRRGQRQGVGHLLSGLCSSHTTDLTTASSIARPMLARSATVRRMSCAVDPTDMTYVLIETSVKSSRDKTVTGNGVSLQSSNILDPLC